ncbi:sulfotransferase domain-containing protein [Rhizobium alvei]|uniref:Sulfotransferase domain-containing protein n=1 Tax=Rhizobium alvei TaxID=1132659 RepID=A0ABT8YGJ8_9HYPH|nr:sulfotransferase domain-containing protein [Rhizobium alvei]MDO6962771.1 sulfotransferase domain-containing protein [Rhizobium alvei]
MLLLHVGPHKTATTWLQTNFHHNVTALEGAGWLYPLTGERVRIAHHDLSDNPREIEQPDSRKVQELIRIGKRAKARNLNILLSSEGFRHWTPSQIRLLQKHLQQPDLHIVYGLRDPVSLLYSFWAQQVKSGTTLTFPQFVQRQRKRPGRVRLLDPRKEIARFARMRKARLTLLAYDRIRKGERDIFDVFAQDVLGVPSLEMVDRAAVNEREPLELTEFMRLVLKRMDGKGKTSSVKIGQLFKYMLGTEMKQKIISTIAAVPAARRTLVIDRDSPKLQRIEEQLLRRYRAKIHPAPGDEGLFLHGKVEFAYYDEEELLKTSEVSRLVGTIAWKFRPSGLHVMTAAMTRFWLIVWRRFLKLFR